MANKPIKQAKVITPEQVREQKQNQALQFLAQRREQFAYGILCNMVHDCGYDISHGNTDYVETAVKMADLLLEKLYPIQPKEEKE